MRIITALLVACITNFASISGSRAQDISRDPIEGYWYVYFDGLDYPKLYTHVYRNEDGNLTARPIPAKPGRSFARLPEIQPSGEGVYKVSWSKSAWVSSEEGNIKDSVISGIPGAAMSGAWETKSLQGQENWVRARPQVSHLRVMEQRQMNHWGVFRGVSFEDRFSYERRYGEKLPIGAPVTFSAPFSDAARSSKQPKIFLMLYGEDLWAEADIQPPPDSGLTIAETNWLICDPSNDDGGFINTNLYVCAHQNGVAGRIVTLAIGPDARAGPAYIRYNDQIIPFNLDLPDHEANDVFSLPLKIADLSVEKTPETKSLLSEYDAYLTAKKNFDRETRFIRKAEREWSRQWANYYDTVEVLEDDLEDAFIAAEKDREAGLTGSPAIQNYEVEKEQYRLRRQLADSEIEGHSALLREQLQKYDTARFALTETEINLDHAKANTRREIISISLPTGFAAERNPDAFYAQTELDNAIDAFTRAMQDADATREAARTRVLLASEALTIASDKLINREWASVWAQLAAEGAFQTYDGLKAFEGGPTAFLTWAGNRMYSNWTDPPKIYEPEFVANKIPLSPDDILETYHVTDGKMLQASQTYGQKKVWKTAIQSLPSDWSKRTLVEAQMTRLIRDRARLSSETASYTYFTQEIEKQYKYLRKADNSFRAKTGEAGKAAFAKQWGKDLIKDELKGLANQKIKETIARVFTTDAWLEYTSANSEFIESVRQFRLAGNVYWFNRDILTGLNSIKDATEDLEFASDTNWTLKSKPVEIVPNTILRLGFTGIAGDLQTGIDGRVYPRPISVSLNGIDLPRLAGTNHFILTAEQIALLGKTDTENAKLSIQY